MPVFNRGETVRIVEPEEDSYKTYIIKKMIKCRKGTMLYLLKSLEEEQVMRLYSEDKRSLLERIC
jgi:hypothetical protein